jgi:hypothetical protein
MTVALVDGTAQTAVVGQAVTTRPAVKVTTNGVATPNSTVTFAVTSGGGSVSGGTVTTGADGIARVGGWTLGTTVGANTLAASVSGASGSPVTFTAIGTAGAAALVAKVSGDGGTSGVGLAVTAKPTVKVTDAFGNPVSGAIVNFVVGSGGGAVNGASAVTGSDGTAGVGGWTLGSVPGANTLIATVVGSGISGNPLTFSVTGVAGPAVMTKVAGDNQLGSVGVAVPIAPEVNIADQFGNAVAGQSVTFAVASGGGAVLGPTQITNASGVATVGGWTLGPTAGANSLTATAGTLTATFTATGTSGSVFDPTKFAGTYGGAWNNTTFATTGTGSAIITVSGSTVSMTASATGSVLGSGSVAATTRSAVYTPTGASFTGNVPPMGDITGTIDVNGKISASGVNVPNATIARWDASGTITPTAISMSFKVTFTSGSTAVGTIDLRRP